MAEPRTLLDKVWEAHTVRESAGGRSLLYVDLHLVHEVTSPQAFDGLRLAGRSVRRPERTVATIDHNVPTTDRSLPIVDDVARRQIDALRTNAAEFGVRLHDIDSEEQGIVHVIGPDQGYTQPGMTIVCGDSHTSTHGAFGALAFGIGTSQVEHVLATQTLPMARPRSLEIRVDGRLPEGVVAKDLVLAIIARIGVDGARGHVIEYTGEGVRALSMEGRMTVCNMSIEAGARAGMIAPDETTFAWLRDRPMAPAGRAWAEAEARWRDLPSDAGASHDRTVRIEAGELRPMVTWGTTPAMAVPLTGSVPEPPAEGPARVSALRALEYMGLEPGMPMGEIDIDRVFIGSCTNGRLDDLRAAGRVLEGRRVHPRVRAMVVPGSTRVKARAEAEGLDRVFRAAGFEWRESGCSMCLGMNADVLAAGERCASTSNRNFEGRQGRGANPPGEPCRRCRRRGGGTVRRSSWRRRGGLMEPVNVVVGGVAPLARADVDTDQIIPKQFLKRVIRTGYGAVLFHDLRGPDFVLDRPGWTDSRILVTGRNFGCGSSREHAAWALHDFGIRAIVAPSFADIFLENCFQVGLVPVVLPESVVAELTRRATEPLEDGGTAYRLRIDLGAQSVSDDHGRRWTFELESHRRRCLMEGLDDIGLTLEHVDDIAAYEAADGPPSWSRPT